MRRGTDRSNELANRSISIRLDWVWEGPNRPCVVCLVLGGDCLVGGHNTTTHNQEGMMMSDR